MDPSTAFLFNATADVLRQKDSRIAEQDSLLKHQQKLLTEQHAEIASLKKKFEELQCHTATVQGRLYDVVAELATLKCKPVEHAETQTEPVKVQETQTEPVKVQETQTEPVKVQETQVQTEVQTKPVHKASAQDAQTQMWFYVDYAWDKTEEFVSAALKGQQALRQEIRQVQAELAEMEAELDGIEVCQTVLLSRVVTAPAPQPIQGAGKPAKKKSKAAKAKQDEAEKAAKAEAELKAHQEAVRARQEQERRQKAQAIADRKAKMQALRTSAEEQVRKETQKQVRLEAAGMAKTGRPDTFVLNTAQIDRVGNFARITKETFSTRGGHAFDNMGEGLPALLGLYVLECFGSESWQLKQADDKFLLVVDRAFGGKKTPVYYQSPSVSAHDIVFWAEKVDFVKGSEFLFKHTPVPADERVAATIINAFELIRGNWAFETLKLRKADLKDDYGLAMQQITLVDKSVMTMTVLKLIIWFRQGRIRAMAMCVDSAKAMAMLQLDLLFEEAVSF